MRPYLDETQMINWLENITTAVAFFNNELLFVDASESWYIQSGLAADEGNVGGDLRERHLFEIFPDLSEDFRLKAQYVVDGLSNVQIIVKGTHPDEDQKVWQLNPWKDGYGQQIGVVAKVKRISKAEKLEIELLRTKQLLNEKGNSARIASWELDLENESSFWTPTIYQILELENHPALSLDELIERIEKPSDKVMFEEAIKLARENGSNWACTFDLTTAKGNKIRIRTVGRPKYMKGKQTKLIGTFQDITEWVQEGLEGQRMSNINPDPFIFNAGQSPKILIDFKTGKILHANPAMSELLSIDTRELISSTVDKIQPLKERLKKEVFKRLKEVGSFNDLELDFVTPTQQERNILLQGTRLPMGNMILVEATDITSYKEKIRVLWERLDESYGRVDRLINFAHITSHNLKGNATNLSVLLNFMKDEGSKEERMEMMKLLIDSSEQFSDAIRGLREIVSIHHLSDHKPRQTSICESLYRAEEIASGKIKKHKAKVVNELPDNLWVKAIPTFLENIFVHFIDFAILNQVDNRNPMICVGQKKKKGATVITVDVNDRGMDMSVVNDSFEGLNKTLGFKGETQGIGLYLIRYQMEILHGQFLANTEDENGSSFELVFPD